MKAGNVVFKKQFFMSLSGAKTLHRLALSNSIRFFGVRIFCRLLSVVSLLLVANISVFPQGPAPVEMKPVLNGMLRDGLIRIELARVINYDERRVMPLTEPSLSLFSKGDLDQLDRSIAFYWDKTGKETSDQSHGVAWKTRENGESMPYELAYLSDEPLSEVAKARILKKAQSRNLKSL